jgi:hypothetical protein
LYSEQQKLLAGRNGEDSFNEVFRKKAHFVVLLEALRVIRDYLVFKAKTRGEARERLRIAIDDYAGEITGDGTALHAKPASIGR